MTVLVIDYDMGNLGSIRRSLEECGADVLVSGDPSELKKAERIILPGVGSFHDGMQNLRKKGLLSALKYEVMENDIPMLGICLGMQLLAQKGYEGGENEGMGLISGEVKKLNGAATSERVPHVGWNEVNIIKEDVLFKDVPNGSDFYFVHSYHFVTSNNENILATTPYCGGFISALRSKNVFGVQFHPEKSMPGGFKILRNFLAIGNEELSCSKSE